MPMGLLYSTDGGATFNTVSVDVADYTLNTGQVADVFISCKDSQNNTYIICGVSTGVNARARLIKISNTGTILKSDFVWDYSGRFSFAKPILSLSRDEKKLLVSMARDSTYYRISIYTIETDFLNGATYQSNHNLTQRIDTDTVDTIFAIYKDQYIWVASGATVKIYDYDTKAELDSETIVTSLGFCCDAANTVYSISTNKLEKLSFNGINIITRTEYALTGAFTNAKQLLIDKYGDLIILTNTGTASTLLKYSNTGTLIDTVSLSVGTNKGAYGLQVYSKDNGTKCWVQFGNDLGTWRTAETTAQGQVFGAVSKLSAINTGELTYGDDNGGDNNYSVRC